MWQYSARPEAACCAEGATMDGDLRVVLTVARPRTNEPPKRMTKTKAIRAVRALRAHDLAALRGPGTVVALMTFLSMQPGSATSPMWA